VRIEAKSPLESLYRRCIIDSLTIHQAKKSCMGAKVAVSLRGKILGSCMDTYEDHCTKI